MSASGWSESKRSRPRAEPQQLLTVNSTSELHYNYEVASQLHYMMTICFFTIVTYCNKTKRKKKYCNLIQQPPTTTNNDTPSRHRRLCMIGMLWLQRVSRRYTIEWFRSTVISTALIEFVQPSLFGKKRIISKRVAKKSSASKEYSWFIWFLGVLDWDDVLVTEMVQQPIFQPN